MKVQLIYWFFIAQLQKSAKTNVLSVEFINGQTTTL